MRTAWMVIVSVGLAAGLCQADEVATGPRLEGGVAAAPPAPPFSPRAEAGGGWRRGRDAARQRRESHQLQLQDEWLRCCRPGGGKKSRPRESLRLKFCRGDGAPLPPEPAAAVGAAVAAGSALVAGSATLVAGASTVAGPRLEPRVGR